jgi:hypothetical protein
MRRSASDPFAYPPKGADRFSDRLLERGRSAHAASGQAFTAFGGRTIAVR